MKYKVLAEVEILGEVRAVDSEVEIDAETAAPFVADGKLAEVSEETPNTSAPETPATPAQPTAPENAASTPEQPKAEKEEWVGNHSVQKPTDK